MTLGLTGGLNVGGAVGAVLFLGLAPVAAVVLRTKVNQESTEQPALVAWSPVSTKSRRPGKARVRAIGVSELGSSHAPLMQLAMATRWTR